MHDTAGRLPPKPRGGSGEEAVSGDDQLGAAGVVGALHLHRRCVEPVLGHQVENLLGAVVDHQEVGSRGGKRLEDAAVAHRAVCVLPAARPLAARQNAPTSRSRSTISARPASPSITAVSDTIPWTVLRLPKKIAGVAPEGARCCARSGWARALGGQTERNMPTVRDAIRLVERDGWRRVRTRGSHRQFHHPEKSGTVTIPSKLGEDVGPWFWSSIMTQAGLRRRSP